MIYSHIPRRDQDITLCYDDDPYFLIQFNGVVICFNANMDQTMSDTNDIIDHVDEKKNEVVLGLWKPTWFTFSMN